MPGLKSAGMLQCCSAAAAGVSWGHRWTGSYNIHTATAHQESCGGWRDFEISFMGGVVGLVHVCEAQGKGRAKGRPRKVTKRSFIDGGWWLVVYLSLMLYIKFG